MKRRIFIKQLLALGLMTPALKVAAVNLITEDQNDNMAAPVSAMADISEWEAHDAVIKVIGVGGASCNALNLMIDQGVYSTEFIAMDSDKQALNQSKARTRFLLDAPNCTGVGEADRAYITTLIKGANVVFIVAGMGGKTGTDAASMVAEISRELNILTVAIVTRPYISEGNRVVSAVKGVRALREHVDTLIVVPIPGLMNISGGTMPEAFNAANALFRDVVANIAEVVNSPGLVAIDFADVCTVLGEHSGEAMIGTAVASGFDRARSAAEHAVTSPLFENMDLSGARGVLVNITSTNLIKLKELDQVMARVQFAAKDATVILAATFDESMGDEMRVAVVATGMKYLSPGKSAGFV